MTSGRAHNSAMSRRIHSGDPPSSGRSGAGAAPGSRSAVSLSSTTPGVSARRAVRSFKAAARDDFDASVLNVHSSTFNASTAVARRRSGSNR